MTAQKKTRAAPGTTDKVLRIETAITQLLRAGVLAGLATIVAGALLNFIHHPRSMFSPAELAPLVQPGAAFPHRLPEIAAGISQMQGRAVMTAGLLILLVLPVLRVALTGLIFIVQKDRLFALLTLIVLSLLLLSLVVGAAG